MLFLTRMTPKQSPVNILSNKQFSMHVTIGMILWRLSDSLIALTLPKASLKPPVPQWVLKR